jgi:hypothetical protein
MEGILTVEKLEKMEPDTVFATGIIIDSDDLGGIVLHSAGSKLRWVAVRGAIPDWAIYYHDYNFPESYIKSYGIKLYNIKVVKKLVYCDKKALKAYRM